MAVVFLSILGAAEYLFFSPSFSQFFQGDALFWMQYRFHNWNQFFTALYKLDVANWYRPLSNRTIPSLFFGWFGLNPYGYHWVVFLLFFLVTCVVFLFLRLLSGSFVAAAFGTVFFSLHSINVYPTYDFAFMPENAYAGFYLLSCIAFLKGQKSKKWYWLSLLCFILALMSKEAAVTLPAILIILSFSAVKIEKKYILPFWGILAIYYLYIVRWLKVGAGDYVIAFNKDILSRLRESLYWAFDLRDGQISVLAAIGALCVCAYALVSLFGSRRRLILLGLGWFFVALSPMLGIVGYFGPYYLFLPLAGIALIVGMCFQWLYEKVSRFGAVAGIAVLCAGMIPFVAAGRAIAQGDLYTSIALGYAGRIAKNSAADLKRLHPAVPRGATIFIVNPDQPDLWRFFGIGALAKLVYADDSIDVLYSSQGHTVSKDLLKSDSLIVMKYAAEHLTDVTAEFKASPDKFQLSKSEDNFKYETSDRFKMEVFPVEIAAGKGSYTIRLSGAANTDADLQYRFNEGPLAFITIHLNPGGETRFFVSTETKRGRYRFVAFRLAGETAWIRAAQQVTVTD